MTTQLYDVRPRIPVATRNLTIGDATNGDRALVGELAELGPATKAFLSLDFEHVVGIFGKRGSGKSFLLGALLEAISWKAKQSEISRVSVPRGAILFDLLNIFQWMPRAKGSPVDVDLFHVPGYSSPTTESQELKLRPQDIAAEEWCILFDVDGIREPMGQCIAEVVAEAGQRQDSSIEALLRILNGMSGRFAPETIRAVQQRFSTYRGLGLFDEQGLPLASLCQANKGSILLFAGVPEDIRSLYVFLVLRKTYEERVRSSQIEKNRKIVGGTDQPQDHTPVPRMWLFIDEAQNIIPPRNASYAVDMLVRYVREGRNFGLSLCFTSQQPSAIDGKIMSQLDTLVSFVLSTPVDLTTIRANLKSPFPKEVRLRGSHLSFDDTIRSLRTGQCIVSNQDASRTVLLAIRERLTPHGGFEG